jgi:hypothetical protein
MGNICHLLYKNKKNEITKKQKKQINKQTNKMTETKLETINGKTIEQLEMEMYPEEMQEKMHKIRSEYEAFDNHNRMLRHKYNEEKEKIEEDFYNKSRAREEANAAAKKKDEEEYQQALAAVNDTLRIIKSKVREGMNEEHIENYRGPLIVDEADESVSSRRKHTLKEKIGLVLKNKAGFRKDLSKAAGFDIDQDTWLVCNEFALRLLQNVNVVIYENKSVEYFNASPDSDWHMGKWPMVKDPKEKDPSTLVAKKLISKQELVKTLIGVVIESDLIPENSAPKQQADDENGDMEIMQEDGTE